VGNYVIADPSNLGNFMIADSLRLLGGQNRVEQRQVQSAVQPE
jgi:hypothetical protein